MGLFDNMKPAYHTGDKISSGVSAPNVGSDYQSLIDANPYRNVTYTIRPWQQFLSWLGFRTGADAWRENMAVQAQEYDASVLQKQYDEEYNSPEAQAQRLRQAGINPDLNNSVSANDASRPMEDPSTPMQSSGDEVQLMQFADGIMNIFTTAVGLTSSIQGVVRNKLENSILKTQSESSLTEFARSMFPYFIPETPNPDDSGGSWYSQALEMANIFAGTLPKSMRSGFVRRASAFWNSAPGEKTAWDAWKQRISSKKDYAFESNTFYDTQTDEVLSVISQELTKLNEDYIKASLKAKVKGAEASEASSDASIAESKNNAEYFNSLDSGLQADTENAQNKFNRTNFDMNQKLNESIGNMINKLVEASKKDGIKGGLASVAMALLASFRLFITTQGLPSVSRSSSSSTRVNGSTGEILTDSSRSSSSFGW